jgi:hypothetical protein
MAHNLTMQFSAAPEPRRAPPPSEQGWWLPVLFLSAVAITLATRWPWIQVQFERLWQHHDGPPGWHTTAGFTCLCTSALVAIMAMAETKTPSSRQAARPGSLMIVTIAVTALAFEAVKGAGTLRGVSAIWTPWFYVTCAALPIMLAICLQRWRALGSFHEQGQPEGPASPC